MSVCFLMPETALESIALGVISRLFILMASAIPGASLSITAFVASGVTSLGAKPVPPVVKTISALTSSQR